MKVMLVFPPQFDVTMPSLSIPCLTAVLRAAGHDVIQKDVNIESFDFLLSKNELSKAHFNVCKERIHLLFSGMAQGELDRLIHRGGYLINEIENAKNTFRDAKAFYNFESYKNSISILKDSLKLISLSFYPSDLSLFFYRTSYSAYSTNQILSAIKDESQNLYIDFYKKFTLPDIKAQSPRMVGISIANESQVIPGLTLSYLIKQANKDIHIVIGGSFFTYLREEMRNNHLLFSLFDCMIFNEGETSLVDLVNCLENGLPLDNVPNLMYKYGTEIIINDIFHTEDITKLPTPCFDGLPLTKYFSPQLVLPLYASRGCYWGRCAFCSFDSTCGSKYRFRGGEKVRKDMEKLLEKHNCSKFTLIDEAIPPNSLLQIAEELIKNEMQIEWFTHARFEKQFNKEIFDKLFKSGCKSLAFGLESGCNRVLSLMDKGITVSTAKDILSASNEAGILNHISFFFGFPGETYEEAMETIKFILDNLTIIHSVSFGYFQLLKDSKTYNEPEKYNIIIKNPNEEYNLALILNYETKSGLNQQESVNITNQFFKVKQDLFKINLHPNCHIALYSTYNNTNDLAWFTACKEESLLGKNEFHKQRLKQAREKVAELFNSI